jgi:hypothetical protein
MATRKAKTEFRDIDLYLTAAGSVGAAAVSAPIDAFKALMNKIEEIESTYETTGAFTDLAGATVVMTGTSPFTVHVFTVTTTIASGVYACVYVETVANHDAVS